MVPTLLSCFTGVGGLDLGLEAAGFDTVGCLETDPHARTALTLNRPQWKHLEPHDVVAAGDKLRPADLSLEPRELTMIAGGPPCQPFSKAAQWASPKRGILDDRGTTVEGMMKLVASFLPAVVLMENVPGFLAGAHNARDSIEASLRQINANHGTDYCIHAWVVNAADYGVPQHRRRVLLMAFREPQPQLASVPLPTTHAEEHRTAWDALGPTEPGDAPQPAGRFADLLPCIPEGANYQYLTAQGAGASHELFGYRTRYWSFLLKLAKDRPAWTLPASPGPSTGPFHWNNRPLTPNERLRLQGFPSEWRLPADVRIGYRLSGNATPPPLAEAAGRFALRVLEEPGSVPCPTDIAPSLAVPVRPAPPPPPRPPAEIPERWQKQIGPKQAHPGAGAGPASHSSTEQGTRQ